jgi:hypothetical protein
VDDHGRHSRRESKRTQHGGELRRWSWYAAAECSDLEMIAMRWRRSAAVQQRKEDGAVGEIAGAVQRSSGSVLFQ